MEVPGSPRIPGNNLMLINHSEWVTFYQLAHRMSGRLWLHLAGLESCELERKEALKIGLKTASAEGQSLMF